MTEGAIMPVCTYDNPDTMSRECWQDSRLLYSYSASMLCQQDPIPADKLFFGANIGPWLPGQLVGNSKAMEG